MTCAGGTGQSLARMCWKCLLVERSRFGHACRGRGRYRLTRDPPPPRAPSTPDWDEVERCGVESNRIEGARLRTSWKVAL